MSFVNIIERLDAHAAAAPGRCALIHDGREHDLAWVSRAVAWLAAALAQQGLGPGAVCALRIRQRRDLLLTQLAIARLGATLVNLSPFDSAALHQDLIARAGASWLLTDDDPPVGVADVAASPLAGAIRTLPLPAIPEAASRVLLPLGAAEPPHAQPQAAWVLLVGSGSTGGVKLLPLSHRAALARGAAYASATGQRPSDRLACLTPLELGFGGIRTAMMLCGGGCVVLLEPHAPVGAEDLRRLGVTILLGGSSHAERLLQDAPPGAPPCLDFLRILLLGGSTVTDDLRQRITRRLTAQLHVNYGCQECGPITMSRPAATGRSGSVGRPIAGCEVRIVAADGRPLPPGEIGRIQVRSPGLIEGYLGDPEATARAFRDGWFLPGDLGRIDADGALIYLGRADHMMIFDGVNIHPAEVEHVISTFPGIADVACLPLPSATDQDIPLCVISVLPDQTVSLAELQGFAFDRLGARRPRRFLVLPAIPRTSTGKLKRAALMAQRSLSLRLWASTRGPAISRPTPGVMAPGSPCRIWACTSCSSSRFGAHRRRPP